MDTIIRALLIGAVIAIGIAAYTSYGDTVRQMFFGSTDEYVVYINQVAFSLSVADDAAERKQGLSGVTELGQYEGKLFIFDEPGKHGIWMKEMLFPIDILWFDNDFKLIHIESNVSPDTYPAVFAPQTEARFVVELNAHAARTFNLSVGNTLTLPTALIPEDRQDAFYSQ